MKIGTTIEHVSKESKSGYPHDQYYMYLGPCRCKDRNTGEWYDAEIYSGSPDGNKLFVREKENFAKEFKESLPKE